MDKQQASQPKTRALRKRLSLEGVGKPEGMNAALLKGNSLDTRTKRNDPVQAEGSFFIKRKKKFSSQTLIKAPI